ncbi:uncharacterized protein LOC125572302 [Nematostella vectensis]|uniref:uncharacterized protein LOC125572302 n=1 Tax=Nematostella vectensis TaxID=45351 RepID=UPI002076E0CD|nr:uncharacterized protein LOC125572302 [Nematostella vectensis]
MEEAHFSISHRSTYTSATELTKLGESPFSLAKTPRKTSAPTRSDSHNPPLLTELQVLKKTNLGSESGREKLGGRQRSLSSTITDCSRSSETSRSDNRRSSKETHSPNEDTKSQERKVGKERKMEEVHFSIFPRIRYTSAPESTKLGESPFSLAKTPRKTSAPTRSDSHNAPLLTDLQVLKKTNLGSDSGGEKLGGKHRSLSSTMVDFSRSYETNRSDTNFASKPEREKLGGKHRSLSSTMVDFSRSYETNRSDKNFASNSGQERLVGKQRSLSSSMDDAYWSYMLRRSGNRRSSKETVRDIQAWFDLKLRGSRKSSSDENANYPLMSQTKKMQYQCMFQLRGNKESGFDENANFKTNSVQSQNLFQDNRKASSDENANFPLAPSTKKTQSTHTVKLGSSLKGGRIPDENQNYALVSPQKTTDFDFDTVSKVTSNEIYTEHFAGALYDALEPSSPVLPYTKKASKTSPPTVPSPTAIEKELSYWKSKDGTPGNPTWKMPKELNDLRSHFRSMIIIAGYVFFPPDKNPLSLPQGSTLRVELRDALEPEHVHGKATVDASFYRRGTKLGYTIICRKPKFPWAYSVWGVLNVGWSPTDHEWLRAGDYVTKNEHLITINEKGSYVMDLSLTLVSPVCRPRKPSDF